MATVFLGLGTNLGDKKQNLRDAIQRISLEVGCVLNTSANYESLPWGFDSENSFLNSVVVVDTNLLPLELLVKTQDIEKTMGRTEKSVAGYADRVIDIDILLYDDLVMDIPELKIPHPLITERDFVLIPLLELAPEMVNPSTGLKYKDITPS